MATNKNALIRYKVLDQCFRNPGRRYFIDDIILACNEKLAEISPNLGGISRRQIFEDISFMESSEGWQVELLRLKDGKRTFYRYKDLSFSINNVPLNETEINYLLNTLEVLEQFNGLPQFDLLNELINKIKVRSSPISRSIVSFESNPYLKGIEFIGVFYDAIHYKKVLNIVYQTFDDDKLFDLQFHPYLLKQYNNRWFVFGYNEINQKSDWNLALDRIIVIEETQMAYRKESGINWDEYFEDIVGVTKPVGAPVEIISFTVQGRTAKYIDTKPLHGSQKSRWIDPQTLHIELELIINYEFERLLLSYCDSIKIISPLHLSNSFSKRLQNAIRLHISSAQK